MEIEALSDERGYALIAKFVGGFASGWKMAVSESFKDALDIKLTPRFFNKKQEMLWTQGRTYNFCAGDIIHDTRIAYERWEESLKHIMLSVHIEFAKSSCYEVYEKYEIKDKDLDVFHQKKANLSEEKIDGLIVVKKRLKHGIVIFRVYRPNKDRTALEKCEVIECTQDDFVAFLQSGSVRTVENKLLNLFTEYT